MNGYACTMGSRLYGYPISLLLTVVDVEGGSRAAACVRHWQHSNNMLVSLSLLLIMFRHATTLPAGTGTRQRN